MTLIDDAWLMDIAAGNAPRAVAAMARAQERLRPELAGRREAGEAVFGAWLDDLAPERLRADALRRALDESMAVVSPGPEPHAPLPRSIARLVKDASAIDRLDWRLRYRALSHIALPTLDEPGVEARLLRLEPGGAIPAHGHDGEELTLVLSGGFEDGRGVYRRGDVCAADADTAHRPQVSDPEPCVCFTVTLGRRRFRNPLIAAADRMLGGLI